MEMWGQIGNDNGRSLHLFQRELPLNTIHNVVKLSSHKTQAANPLHHINRLN